MFTPSDEQKQIIEAPLDEKTIVMATAASGKTATITERLRYILRNGTEPKKVVAITFTNNAAAEMRARLGDDFKPGMFMGTMHSYANSLLTGYGIDTTHIRQDQEFDKLFDLIMMYPESIPEIDYLVCDESQDLNKNQLIFLLDLIQPKACLIAGDVRQSIYGFKDAQPESLLWLMKDEDYVVRELSQNYRNAKKILGYSERFLKKMKEIPYFHSKCMVDEDGTVNYITSEQVIAVLKTDKDYKKWAILCRTNSMIDKYIYRLNKAGIPCITFRQAQGSLEDLRDKMEQPAVKVLTIHSAKGLEFDNVIATNITETLSGKDEEPLRLSYVAVTRAKKKLFIIKN